MTPSCAAKWQGENLLLQLYVQPKASRDQLVGLHGNELKIAITAPPVDGKANTHLTKFLSKQFCVAKGHITITRGELGRHKQVQIQKPQTIPALIQQLL